MGLLEGKWSRLCWPLSPCDCEVAALNLKRTVEIPLRAAGQVVAAVTLQACVSGGTAALMLMATELSAVT
jgi:hypothetical protein